MNIGPNIKMRNAKGAIPSQKMISALMIRIAVLPILALTFEHSIIVHDLNDHPGIGARSAYDTGPEEKRFQVRGSVESEAIIVRMPHVNSDGGHNAGK